MHSRSLLYFFGVLFFVLHSFAAAKGSAEDEAGTPHFISFGEYADFLNQVEPSDLHHFYDEKMMVGDVLLREGAPGSYAYVVKPEAADNPILFVDGNAEKYYANWKQNRVMRADLFLSSDSEATVAAATVDKKLKISNLGLYLEDDADSNVEQNAGHQISSTAGWFVGLGVATVLLGGGYYCWRGNEQQRVESAGEGRLILGDTRNYAAIRRDDFLHEGGSTTALRRKVEQEMDRSNSYFSDPITTPYKVMSNNYYTNQLEKLLNDIRAVSKERQNLIRCLPRDSAINKAYLTFFREQHFNLLVREEIKKSGASREAVRIIQEINMQRGKPAVWSDYFSLRSIIPGWFSLRHDNPIARALGSDRENIRKSERDSILNAVTAARRKLQELQGSGQAAQLSNDVRIDYPYVIDAERKRIAADPDHNPVPPAGFFDHTFHQMGLIPNPEYQIRDRYIHEVVNLINATKQQNSYMRKTFFKQEVNNTSRVTPRTVQLLKQINNNGRLHSFDLQDGGWIARELEQDEPVNFEKVKSMMKSEMPASY